MNREDFRIPRQRFIVAGFAVGASVLAACTTYGKKPTAAASSSAPAPASAPATESAAPAAPANALAKTSDVGSGVIIDELVLTQPSADVFKGLSAICTHAGCTVSEVADGTINCPCHGTKFNLDGSVANDPAQRPLETKNIVVQGDSIVLG